MKNTFTLITFLLFSICIAQNTVEKRKAYTLEIAANEAHQYKMDVQESPYFVKDKILQIYCSEKIFVECEIAADTISSMKVVMENINPNKTIIIDFTQNAKDRTQIGTFLTVNNPFEKTLIYDAMMFTPINQQWKSTSIIPIGPKLQNYEMWPHSIVSLVLDNWRFK